MITFNYGELKEKVFLYKRAAKSFFRTEKKGAKNFFGKKKGG